MTMRDNLPNMLRAAAKEWRTENKVVATGATRYDDALDEAADAIEELLSHLQNAINWTSVEKDGLPSEPGEYIVYVRDGMQPHHPIPGLEGDLSYVTTAYYDPDTCLWKENEEYYNANLACVNKEKTYYISHWADKPTPPKEET